MVNPIQGLWKAQKIAISSLRALSAVYKEDKLLRDYMQ